MGMMKSARKNKDIGITGNMAKWYDKSTRKSRLGEMRGYADLVSGRTHTGASILEIAPGPGYLSIELARRDFCVTGVEISPDFVKIEYRNAMEAGVDINFKQGNAAALPCNDGSFDFVICTAAFKNFKEPVQAIYEMYRVLKVGGTALIIDMNREATGKAVDDYMNTTDMKSFDRWFTKLSFKTYLKNGAYTKTGFEEIIVKTPFQHHEILELGMGLQIWMYR